MIAVEIDGPKNQAVLFAPIQKRIRGRFDLHRVKEPNAGKLYGQWGQPIPGQVIQYDPETGKGVIVEPLHEEQFSAIRERIEGMGMKLPPKEQPFECDADTAVYHLKGLVDGGSATLLDGTIPDAVGTPRTRFHSAEQVSPVDRLAAALERQADLQEKTLEALLKLAAKK